MSCKAPHTFFPYIGSKFRHVDKFIPLIPRHDLYIEVFGGSAALLFNKPYSHHEILNDINGDLVNLYWVVAFRYNDFIELLSRMPLHSRGFFYKLKEHPLPFSCFNDVDYELYRAVRTFLMLWNSFSGNGLLSNSSFSPKGRMGGTRREKTASIQSLETLQYFHCRLRSVTLEQLDFAELISKYNESDVFLYCDPPYLDMEHYYTLEEDNLHMKLFETLRGFKGKWMLSYNNNAIIKELYSDFHVFEIKLWYTAAFQNNAAKELLILNYDPTQTKMAYNGGQKRLTDFLKEV